MLERREQVEALALSAPTEIQRIGVPEVLAGGDVLLMSQVRACCGTRHNTGSHVTSCYALRRHPAPQLRALSLLPWSPPFESYFTPIAQLNNDRPSFCTRGCENLRCEAPRSVDSHRLDLDATGAWLDSSV